MGTDDAHVAGVLYQLARCIREGYLDEEITLVRAASEAEEMFQRTVEIQEAKLGPDAIEVC